MSEALMKINNLITALTSWLTQIFVLYFSNTPANATVKRIKSDGTLENVEIPNIAQSKLDLLSAANIFFASAHLAGDAGGAGYVELAPDIEGAFSYGEGVTFFDIDLYSFTDAEITFPSHVKLTVCFYAYIIAEVYNYTIKVVEFSQETADLNGALEYGISGSNTYTGVLVAGGTTSTPRLHLFGRNEANLDPAKISHFKAVVKKIAPFVAPEA